MQPSSLTPNELVRLQSFRYTPVHEANRHAIHFSDLLEPRKIHLLLERVSKETGAPTQRVAASVLMKRIAFYAVIHLYAMTAFEKRLIVHIEELKLIDNRAEDHWLPNFHFGEYTVEPAPKDRSGWRDEVIRNVFRDTIHPLIAILSKQARISERIMWENISLYIFWLYETHFTEEDTKAMDDLHYLIHGAPGTLFGGYDRNPMTEFDGVPICSDDSNELARIRKTCCLSHLLEGSNRKMCKTCPLLTKKAKETILP